MNDNTNFYNKQDYSNTHNQSFSNVSSTFDIILPEDNNETITPLSTIVSEKSPALSFSFELFKQKPELFGVYALSLIYAQYSGTAYKSETVYSSFELFVKHQSKNQINASQTRELRPYEFDVDLLITWARLMQKHKTNIIFEPVMSKLSQVLNNWLSNRKVNYGGVNYDISVFRPFCYTANGENFITLLPYLCYVMTFLIHCRPYTFNEAQTESSTYGFYKSLDAYYALNYAMLGKDYNINIVRSSIEELSAIPDEYFVDMFKVMLHPDKIIKIRNDEMSKTPELLDECISDQNGLTYEFVRDAWNITMTQMIKIVLNHTPIKRIFDKIPTFKSNVLNVNDLMLLTQYCLAGGNTNFCIDDVTYSYMNHCDRGAVKQLPPNVFGKQELISNIKQLSTCIGEPFCANDFILELCTAYIRNEFEARRSDILNDKPIKIDESMLRNDNLSIQLKDMFIPALWMNSNSTMYNAIAMLEKIPRFRQEVNDLLSLYNSTLLFYDNRIASIVIPVLLLSYLNDMILNMCVSGGRLEYFSIHARLMDLEIDTNRVMKLMDMVVSLMYINSNDYVTFVNSVSKEFNDVIVSNPKIQQVYVKGLNDMADAYAIGGCDLYNYARHDNPLVRGYGWIKSVYGNCECLEMFRRWCELLSNSSLMELLESSVSNPLQVENSLKIQFDKLLREGRQPVLLSNYEFENNTYKRKNYPYVLNYELSNGKSLIELVCEHVFARSNAKDGCELKLVMKEIKFNRNKLQVMKSVENGMQWDDNRMPASVSEGGSLYKLPVYNFEGRIENTKIMFTNIPSHRLIVLNTMSTNRGHNQTVFVFTKLPVKTRFQKYDYEGDDRLMRRVD